MPRTVTVIMDTYGTEQVNGRRARKVSKDDVPYLESTGWTVARYPGGGSSYVRMYPPADGDTKNPTIELKVPTNDELLAQAKELQQQGQTWAGAICGWTARFIPYHVRRGQHHIISTRTDAPAERMEAYEYISPSELNVFAGPWRATVRWNDGEDEQPRLFVTGE